MPQDYHCIFCAFLEEVLSSLECRYVGNMGCCQTAGKGSKLTSNIYIYIYIFVGA